jgi:hypothetical protein
VREELPQKVQEELRGLDADFWGPIALEGYLKRGWVMPAIIVVLTIVAIVEGIFLLRAPSEQTYIVTEPFPTEESAKPRAAQPANVLPSPGVIAPNTNVPPPIAPQRQSPAAKDLPAANRAVQPRPSPAVQPTRPAPAAASEVSARAPGWITVSSPIELNLSEKGSLLGSNRGPRILLPAGGHVLQLENSAVGYRENQWVRIHAGKETTLAVTLPQGVVHVNATPWADISIDGKSFGQTPIGNLKLTIGAHDVVFRHPDLGEKTVSALVKVGVPTRVSADLTQR